MNLTKEQHPNTGRQGMKILIFMVISFLLIASPSSAGKKEPSITGACKQKWGTDYSMVRWCVRKESHAGRKVTKLLSEYKDNKEVKQILVRCAIKWKYPNGAYIFSMVNWCFNKQYEAYRLLQ